MPPLDFPNAPSLNQLFAGPNNVQWQWDGSKWLGTPNTLGPIIVAASPPTFVSGQLWWDSTGGNLYLAYDDGNTQQWVPATNVAGLANAATTMDVDKALGNVGRNLIHNSMFNIAQRGAGSWTTAGYGLDRWQGAVSGDTFSWGQNTHTDTTRAQIGDEAATYYMACSFTGTAGAGAFTVIFQGIEDVRRLAGKTVTVSFWANASVGTLKLGVSCDQNFGTGGSPSAGVSNNGQSVTLFGAGTWTRYSMTFTLPSVSGKTLGTTGSNTTLLFWYSSGSTNSARSGGVPVQSGAINLWGVQLEIVQPGQTVPTKLEKRDPVLELQQCQRFFQTGAVSMYAYNTAGAYVTQMLPLPVTLRSNTPVVTPTLTPSNLTGVTMDAQGPGAVRVVATATATGACNAIGSFTASADL